MSEKELPTRAVRRRRRPPPPGGEVVTPHPWECVSRRPAGDSSPHASCLHFIVWGARVFLWGSRGSGRKCPGGPRSGLWEGRVPSAPRSPVSLGITICHRALCTWQVLALCRGQAQALTVFPARVGGPEAHLGLHRAERRQLRGVFEAGAPGTTPGTLGGGREGHFARNVWGLWSVLRGRGQRSVLLWGQVGLQIGTLRIADAVVFMGGLHFLKQIGVP